MTKKKLAYISPMPPDKTGVATYSAKLLPYLKEYYDIDVITKDKADYFKKHHYIYQRVLYHIGNSSYHDYIIELLYFKRGVVFLHDFYLSHLLHDISPITQKQAYLLAGYQALFEQNTEKLLWNYPLNKEILNLAIGILSHSHYTQELAKKHYYSISPQKWHTVAFPQKLHIPQNKDKTKLNFPKDSFLFCSFGIIGENKLNTEILKAWINSSTSKNKKANLIFVGGATHDKSYLKKLSKIIQKATYPQNIHITNWIDDDTYKDYLSICDVAIQLRTNSRGETQATLFDTLSFSIPTIANAHATTNELPKNTLFLIQDNFTTDELTLAIDTLYTDEKKRQTLQSNSTNYIKTYHLPKLSAKEYYKAIESSYKLKHYTRLDTKTYFFTSPDTINQRQILVDISSIIKHDLKTGIQRVVKAQLQELIKLSPKHTRIEPVYLREINGEFRHFYARNYTAKLTDEIADINKGDIFYGLDLCYYETSKLLQTNLYKRYKAIGIKFVYLIYDLLPITHPHFFPTGAKQTHQEWFDNITLISDQLIAISKTVADQAQKLSPIKLNIDYIHLGAQLPTKQNPTFLMVGTIEPRKGHSQVLEAFELLWQKNHDLDLVIIGKEGWMMQEFLQKLKTHPKLNKNLFYLEQTDDATLQNYYKTSTALIYASQAEGFGLPLIEASHYNLPIIARDIPVFKEVAKTYPSYFPNTNDPKILAEFILNYLNKQSSQKQLPYLTWEQSTKKLLDLLLEK